MIRVLLLGLAEKEATRLQRALTAADEELDVVPVVNGRLPGGSAVERGVGVVSGAGRSELIERVKEAREAGLPVVALLPEFTMGGLDPARGQVDFCFPPFAPEEIALRVRALAARASGPRRENMIIRGDLAIDQGRYEVTVSGRKVDLTYKEYELLRVLASNPGHVYSREALLRTVWEYDYFGGTRTVDVHVRRLRSKINDVEHRFIETVWSVGYRFRAPDDDQP